MDERECFNCGETFDVEETNGVCPHCGEDNFDNEEDD